jgi:hypothetical protein
MSTTPNPNTNEQDTTDPLTDLIAAHRLTTPVQCACGERFVAAWAPRWAEHLAAVVRASGTTREQIPCRPELGDDCPGSAHRPVPAPDDQQTEVDRLRAEVHERRVACADLARLAERAADERDAARADLTALRDGVQRLMDRKPGAPDDAPIVTKIDLRALFGGHPTPAQPPKWIPDTDPDPVLDLPMTTARVEPRS